MECLCRQGEGARSKSGGTPPLIGIDETIWLQRWEKKKKNVTRTPGFTQSANRWGHRQVVAVEGTQANEVFAVGHNPGQKKKTAEGNVLILFLVFFSLLSKMMAQK